MVAAWMSAEPGVGPSMASGSQMKSGACADLPAAPMRMPMPMTVATAAGMSPLSKNWAICESWKEPTLAKMRRRARYSPLSPSLVVMKAFFWASHGPSRSNQKPISR